MKKFFSLVMCIFAITFAANADRAHQLKVLNWADYISPEVIEEFPIWYEQQTGEEVEIVYSTFDINESALSTIEMGKEDYDLFCPSEYIIEKMINDGLVKPIRKDLIPDSINYFSNVSPFAVEKFNQMSDSVNVEDYATGYMWGTTGWLYNKNLVDSADLTSWSALTNPKYTGKIFLKDAYRDVYFCLVQYCYRDSISKDESIRRSIVSDINQEKIDTVYKILASAKDNIEGYEVDFGKEAMVKGEGALNLSWSGDAYWAMQEANEDVELDYIVPNEGSNVWFDGWVVPKYAKNEKAAAYFIDFLCREDNVLKNMNEIGYVSVIATPNIIEEFYEEGYEPVNLEYLLGPGYDKCYVNPVLYPDQSVIARCEIMHDAKDKNVALLEMWNKAKGSSLNYGTIIVVILFVIAILVYISYKVLVYLNRKEAKKTLKKK